MHVLALCLSLLSLPGWSRVELAALDSIEPSIRQSARDRLMAGDPARLGDLLESARSVSLSGQQRASLAEIVVHLHVAGLNRREGVDVAQLGIRSQQPRFEIEQDLPQGARVGSRLVGYDAQRVLQDGDRIVHIAEPSEGMQWEITQFDDLRQVTRSLKPGALIRVTVIRDGRRLAADLRLAKLAPGMDDPSRLEAYDRWLITSRRFWNEQVEPTLKPEPN
jgi:hypothetical protein